MFDQLTALGYGIIVFAIIIGVGSVVLFNFGNAIGTCTADKTINTSTGLCQNATGTATPGGDGYVNTNYLLTQLGQSGLAGWTPAIIAISVGLLFLGAFLVGGKGKGRY